MNKSLFLIFLLLVSDIQTIKTLFENEKEKRDLKEAEAEDYLDYSFYEERLKFKPTIPNLLKDLNKIQITDGEKVEPPAFQKEIQEKFKNIYGQPMSVISEGSCGDIHRKLRVGIILSGANAPGGHNVIAGLYDALKEANNENVLIGFKGGAQGILDKDCIEVDDELMNKYRNTGGSDMLGSGRTKIETPSQLDQAFNVINELHIDAVVVVGGDDSNTNAALLAEFFKSKDSDVTFVGVPKTIDGDLKNEYIETSFGFDTATKTYAELVGNIQRDAVSSRKYWHFVKIMGRFASHVALEVALRTQPTWTLLTEEIKEKKFTLTQVAGQIADLVELRAKRGFNFGVVLVPEGLLEFIPEIKDLIQEINELLEKKKEQYSKIKSWNSKMEFVLSNISMKAGQTFQTLPENIASQLLLDRDPEGNINLSAIETEKLLSDIVNIILSQRKSKAQFNPVHHFFGYEGRCGFPSNFDANYCYALGRTAMILSALKKTGQMAIISNLNANAEEWKAGGFPLTSMMNMEKRGGNTIPVIQKALVDLTSPPFEFFAKQREKWSRGDKMFAFPGAIQYYGEKEIADQPTKTLLLEKGE
jgi:pyrophosphate--fructose-6-phosphate 1-phosphotransferase